MPRNISDRESLIQVGKRLKHVRESKRLSQCAVSSQIGIQRASLSKIEKGLSSTSFLVIKKLADVYGYPVEYFVSNGKDGMITIPESALLSILETSARQDFDRIKRSGI